MDQSAMFTFLGTGTSGGVPSLGCDCAVCRSLNPLDHRLRSAALLECGSTRLLIDCGPDIRQQLMPFPFKPITAVLLTHVHYDHVGGLDDLRPFSVFGDINVYADQITTDGIHRVMPYCFTEKLYPGVPKLKVHTIDPHHPFTIGGIRVMPICVMHGKMPILAYRFGSLAYITDMKSISDEDREKLVGVHTLVVNALRWEKVHHSHMLVHDAIDFARSIGAQRTYFTHMTHRIGLHDEANGRLPKGFAFAYDGQSLRVKL